MTGTVERNISTQQKFLCAVLIVGILITAVSVILSYYFKTNNKTTSITDTITLYTVTDPVGIHVHVHCDYRPDSLSVIAPDNTVIDSFSWENEHAADITLDCAIEGVWKLNYTAPSDDNVVIHTDVIPINRLVIRNLTKTVNDTSVVISFFPYFGDGEQTDQYFNYDLYATNYSKSKYISMSHIEFWPVNTAVTITYPLSDIPEDVETLHLVTASPYQTNVNSDALANTILIDLEDSNEETE